MWWVVIGCGRGRGRRFYRERYFTTVLVPESLAFSPPRKKNVSHCTLITNIPISLDLFCFLTSSCVHECRAKTGGQVHTGTVCWLEADIAQYPPIGIEDSSSGDEKLCSVYNSFKQDTWEAFSSNLTNFGDNITLPFWDRHFVGNKAPLGPTGVSPPTQRQRVSRQKPLTFLVDRATS